MLTPRCTPVCLDAVAPPPRWPTLPPRFTLLVWNVQKLPFSRLARCGVSLDDTLCAFQEARLPRHEPPALPWRWAMTPNLGTRRAHFGVLTASLAPMQPVAQLLTPRERLLRTHKSALMTLHPLADGRTLALLNVHMLLTSSPARIQQTLETFDTWLHLHDGPLIVAGDFNTWSRRRLRQLYQWTECHRLAPAPLYNAGAIKRVRRWPLDHVFWRGLILEHATVVETACSDHNPVRLAFALPIS